MKAYKQKKNLHLISLQSFSPWAWRTAASPWSWSQRSPMASGGPAEQLEGRRTAAGISVDSDKVMKSFQRYWERVWAKVLPGGGRTSARSRWFCSPDSTGRAAEWASSASSKVAIIVAFVFVGASHREVFMLPRVPVIHVKAPTTHHFLLRLLRARLCSGCGLAAASLNCFDEIISQIVMTERFCQQGFW